MRVALLGLVAALAPNFWASWGDGKGELTGYQLTQQRYGETRSGTAVMVFVTEPWSQTARVKADDGKHPPQDVLQVMKLNLVEDFQTGIYDYNLMTSMFVGVDTGAPLKLAFGAQEWCGQAMELAWWKPDGQVTTERHSYFDGEGDETGALDGRGVVFGDLMFHLARGFAAGLPAPGGTVDVKAVPRFKELRLLHQALVPLPATLSRGKSAERIKTPAGTFSAEKITLAIQGGTTMHVWVEQDGARRVVAWEVVGQERAEMTGGFRDAYWGHHNNGDEALLSRLGLKAARMR